MSFTSATNAIKALLVADPIDAAFPSITLHYAPDPRAESLADHPAANLDAAFLLVGESLGNAYPYVQGTSPSEWYGKMRLEVATLLHTDILTQDQTAEARAHAIKEVLEFNTYADFVIFNVEEPRRERVGGDRRVIWTWRFSVRYNE